MKNFIFLFAALSFAACNNSSAPTTATTEEHHDHAAMEEKKDTTAILPGQRVFFGNLEEGQEIRLPYIVKFEVEGMKLVPAMGVVENEGHHHLMVDQSYIPSNTMVPMQKESEGFYHFGKGQPKDTLNIRKYPMLTPGKHRLTLQFANGMHMSYGPAMSKTVTVIVK